jgi:hypothetical protein
VFEEKEPIMAAASGTRLLQEMGHAAGRQC